MTEFSFSPFVILACQETEYIDLEVGLGDGSNESTWGTLFLVKMKINCDLFVKECWVSLNQ